VNTGVSLDTRVHGPCSRAPVHTNREHGPSTLDTARVLASGISRQCFLPTRPVDTGARYTLPVFTGRRSPRAVRQHGRQHGCRFRHPWIRI